MTLRSIQTSTEKLLKHSDTNTITETASIKRELVFRISEHSNIEFIIDNLANTAFQFKPDNLEFRDAQLQKRYLNELNRSIFKSIEEYNFVQLSLDELFGKSVLRNSDVNFRTNNKAMDYTLNTISAIGKDLDIKLREKLITK